VSPDTHESVKKAIDKDAPKLEKLDAALTEAQKGEDQAAIKAARTEYTKAKTKALSNESKARAKEGYLPKMPKIGAISGKEKGPDDKPLYPKDQYKKSAKGTWLQASEIFGKDWLKTGLIMFVFCLVILMIAGIWLKFDLKLFPLGFFVIFALAVLAAVVGKQYHMKNVLYLSPVIFALVFGLIISNFFKVPKFLVAARQTEFYVKIGLVAMGAGILFGDVVRAGVWGILQAILVAVPVWFMTYWICRKFKISERFSAIISTANSICGVSATIAAGGAIQGKPKEVSYMVAWVLVCAVVLILVMPPIAAALGLGAAWSGAWVGGVIDNTGAVVAAGDSVGSRLGEGAGDIAVTVASIVKMAQNVLIGFAAFFMALWATLSLEKKEAGADYQKPGLMEVWYRFPKFVVGFIVASLVVSALDPVIGTGAVKAIGGEAKVFRNLFFGLCFVSIGLETNFKELISVGGGRPAIAYWLSQTANAFWTLFITWILWSGQVLPSPF
jgi:uncharacterized membrane protein YadS